MKRVVLSSLLLAFVVTGCSDSVTIPPPPDPPPQLAFRQTWNISGTASGSDNTPFLLPDNEVYDVFLDSQSRVWMSTEAGMSMKDGSADVVVFDDFDGIPVRKCRGIAELNGKIWVGTWGKGVAIYDGTLPWTSLPAGPNRVADGKVFAVAEDGPNLWIGTVAGLTRYIDDESLTLNARYRSWIFTGNLGAVFQSPESANITSIVVRGSEIWMTTRGAGVQMFLPPFQAQTLTSFRTDNSDIPDNFVADMVYDTANQLFWFACETVGLASYDPAADVWAVFATTDGLQSALGSSVAVASDGEIWFGTQKGVSRMRGNDITNFVKGSGLPDERIRTTYIDRNDQLWMSFVDAGAAKASR